MVRAAPVRELVEKRFDRTASEISVEERRAHLVLQMSKWRVK
jgi:hypothetical protein